MSKPCFHENLHLQQRRLQRATQPQTRPTIYPPTILTEEQTKKYLPVLNIVQKNTDASNARPVVSRHHVRRAVAVEEENVVKQQDEYENHTLKQQKRLARLNELDKLAALRAPGALGELVQAAALSSLFQEGRAQSPTYPSFTPPCPSSTPENLRERRIFRPSSPSSADTLLAIRFPHAHVYFPPFLPTHVVNEPTLCACGRSLPSAGSMCVCSGGAALFLTETDDHATHAQSKTRADAHTNAPLPAATTEEDAEAGWESGRVRAPPDFSRPITITAPCHPRPPPLAARVQATTTPSSQLAPLQHLLPCAHSALDHVAHLLANVPRTFSQSLPLLEHRLAHTPWLAMQLPRTTGVSVRCRVAVAPARTREEAQGLVERWGQAQNRARVSAWVGALEQWLQRCADVHAENECVRAKRARREAAHEERVQQAARACAASVQDAADVDGIDDVDTQSRTEAGAAQADVFSFLGTAGCHSGEAGGSGGATGSAEDEEEEVVDEAPLPPPRTFPAAPAFPACSSRLAWVATCTRGTEEQWEEQLAAAALLRAGVRGKEVPCSAWRGGSDSVECMRAGAAVDAVGIRGVGGAVRSLMGCVSERAALPDHMLERTEVVRAVQLLVARWRGTGEASAAADTTENDATDEDAGVFGLGLDARWTSASEFGQGVSAVELPRPTVGDTAEDADAADANTDDTQSGVDGTAADSVAVPPPRPRAVPARLLDALLQAPDALSLGVLSQPPRALAVVCEGMCGALRAAVAEAEARDVVVCVEVEVAVVREAAVRLDVRGSRPRWEVAVGEHSADTAIASTDGHTCAAAHGAGGGGAEGGVETSADVDVDAQANNCDDAHVNELALALHSLKQPGGASPPLLLPPAPRALLRLRNSVAAGATALLEAMAVARVALGEEEEAPGREKEEESRRGVAGNGTLVLAGTGAGAEAHFPSTSAYCTATAAPLPSTRDNPLAPPPPAAPPIHSYFALTGMHDPSRSSCSARARRTEGSHKRISTRPSSAHPAGATADTLAVTTRPVSTLSAPTQPHARAPSPLATAAAAPLTVHDPALSSLLRAATDALTDTAASLHSRAHSLRANDTRNRLVECERAILDAANQHAQRALDSVVTHFRVAAASCLAKLRSRADELLPFLSSEPPLLCRLVWAALALLLRWRHPQWLHVARSIAIHDPAAEPDVSGVAVGGVAVASHAHPDVAARAHALQGSSPAAQDADMRLLDQLVSNAQPETDERVPARAASPRARAQQLLSGSLLTAASTHNHTSAELTAALARQMHQFDPSQLQPLVLSALADLLSEPSLQPSTVAQLHALSGAVLEWVLLALDAYRQWADVLTRLLQGARSAVAVFEDAAGAPSHVEGGSSMAITHTPEDLPLPLLLDNSSSEGIEVAVVTTQTRKMIGSRAGSRPSSQQCARQEDATLANALRKAVTMLPKLGGRVSPSPPAQLSEDSGPRVDHFSLAKQKAKESNRRRK